MVKKIVFVGCVREGKEALNEILLCGGNVVGIFTFTDELAKGTSGAVNFEDISEAFKIPIFKVRSTNDKDTIQLLRGLAPDVIFVVGWTRLLSKAVLDIPTIGCLGFHASLLPKYRGRAPVNWAIINGEKVTGNSIMILDEGVDTGDVIAQRNISISISDTCATLYDKVSDSGREMIREVLHELECGAINRTVQKDKEAVAMAKRKPEDGIIDWDRSGIDIYNWVRALTHPYPGAFTYFLKKR